MTRSLQRTWPGVPWVAPAVALLLALSIYPLLYSIQVSFTGRAGEFTFSHYVRLTQDRLFLQALGQTLLYTAVALTF
jgi:ABC-type sugar transport system permease subunit